MILNGGTNWYRKPVSSDFTYLQKAEFRVSLTTINDFTIIENSIRNVIFKALVMPFKAAIKTFNSEFRS